MIPPIKNCNWAKYPKGDVTQYFSENPELYSKAVIINGVPLKGHNGIDIVRPWGEHMYAVEDGKVSDVKNDAGGYGKHVRIKSIDGKREWTYGHCSKILVAKGELVKEGQYIADMGNTGFVVTGETPYWDDDPTIKENPYAGTHVHFGLRLFSDGKVQNYNNGYFGSINPLAYFVPKLSDRLLLTNETSAIGRILKSIGL